MDILKIRNSAVHKVNVNLENVENYFNALCDYLLNKPQTQKPINIVGQIDLSNFTRHPTIYKSQIIKIQNTCFYIDKNNISPKFNEVLYKDCICYEMDFIKIHNLEVGNIVHFELKPTQKGYLAFNLKI